MAPPHEIPRNEEIAVERRDAPPWLAAALGGGLAVALALSIALLAMFFPDALRGPSDAPRLATAEPRLEINPAADLEVLRVRQETALATYGWVDRERGIVRIPIDRAIADVAASGIADWPKEAR